MYNILKRNIFQVRRLLNKDLLCKRNFCELNQKEKKPKFNVLFFGNDEISLPSLDKLIQISKNINSPIEKLTVVTTPNDNKKSTQGIFHKFLNSKEITKIYLDKKNLNISWIDLEKTIKEEKYNIGLIASFGQMIPKEIISTLNNKIYVMHPSLLPKYRGGAPIQHTLLNNEKKTGVTICEASIDKFDAGDIVIQKEINVEIFHRFKELSLILSNLGAEAIFEFIENYDKIIMKKYPQDNKLSCKAPLINGEIYLNFLEQDAEEICRNYKAFYGSQIEPFTKFVLNKNERQMFFENLFIINKLSIHYTKTLQLIDNKAKPGDIYWDLKSDRNFIFIKAKNDWVASSQIKLNGTNYLKADFLITKLFMNKRFDEINKDKLNFKTLNIK